MTDSEEYRRDILNKVKQDPIPLQTDGEMWEMVWDKISNEKPVKKNYFVWYASAAAVLLCLIAGATVIFISNPSSQIAISDRNSIPESEQDKKTVKEQEGVKPSKDLNKVEAQKKSEQAVYERQKKEIQTNLSTEKELVSKRLSDGSKVTLNSFTHLNVTAISKTNFTSNLSGEAYFEIKPDKKRSFKVSFGNSYLMVLGTKFNVRNVKGEAYQQIAVVEGIVKVYPAKSEKGIEVKRGELLKISLDKNTSQITKINPLHFIAWKTGLLNFKKSTMKEVASPLERVYNITIVVDENVKACTFTGNLSQTPLEEALQIIEATTSLKIKRTKNSVHISGKPCN
jgi:hypothetical protein